MNEVEPPSFTPPQGRSLDVGRPDDDDEEELRRGPTSDSDPRCGPPTVGGPLYERPFVVQHLVQHQVLDMYDCGDFWEIKRASV